MSINVTTEINAKMFNDFLSDTSRNALEGYTTTERYGKRLRKGFRFVKYPIANGKHHVDALYYQRVYDDDTAVGMPFNTCANMELCCIVVDGKDIYYYIHDISDFCSENQKVLSKDEIETEMTIHAVYNNMQVDNVVITYRDRPEGSESKLNTYSDGFRVLKTIFRMFRQYRPFAFFGLLALLLFVIAVGFFIPVGIEYVETGLVPKFPTLIACGFAGLAALQSLFAGLILHNLGVKDRRDFEFRLQIVGKDTKE